MYDSKCFPIPKPIFLTTQDTVMGNPLLLILAEMFMSRFEINI